MRSLRGVESVAFLDSQGELILHSGAGDPERLRIIGAYQGIFIACALRTGLDHLRTVYTRFERRAVLTRALKDGYFISVIFSPELNYAYAQFHFEEFYNRLESEL